MTSDVTARTRLGFTLPDVFSALFFPCGSVTGAPEIEAMRAIHALEPDARRVYGGGVGVVRPGGAATFKVAIRTNEIDGDATRAAASEVASRSMPGSKVPSSGA